MSDVPEMRACQLCAAIRQDANNPLLIRLWCWGCTKLAPRVKAARRWAQSPGNRGCSIVNKLYDAEERQFRRQIAS